MKRESLLVIPHAFAETSKIRGVELARGLAEEFDVYCIRWKDAILAYGNSEWSRRLRRLNSALTSLVARCRIVPSGRLRYIELPVIQPILFNRIIGQRRALALAATLNAKILMRCLKRVRPPIRKVLASARHYDLKALTNLQVWLDIWDIELVDEERFEEKTLRDYCAFVKDAGTHCRGILIPNGYLQAWLRDQCGVRAEVVSTGTWVEESRRPDLQCVQAIRKRYGLEGKFVVGYIGNHTDSAGIDFFMDVARVTTATDRDIAFMLVGPLDSHWLPVVSPFRSHPQVVLTGPVRSEEVVNYLHCMDVGVYCSPPRFRHRSYTLPLKLVEYSAARRFVLSTPSEVVRHLDWPSVIIPAYEPGAWCQAIQRLRNMSWDPQWDLLVEEYDWRRIAGSLARFLRTDGSVQGNGKLLECPTS